MRVIWTALIGGILGASAAFGADINCATIKIVVPNPAGGAADVAARLVGERLEATLKKAVAIENRGGGHVAITTVINAPPDGCTMLIHAATISTFGTSYSKLPFDPLKDLVAVGGVGETPTVWVSAPANDMTKVNDLIRRSKEKPEGMSFGTAGVGLLQHLAAEEIAQRSGAKFVHIPYKGGSQAVPDLITGRVDFGSFAAGSMVPPISDGKLKALAVIQPKRSALLPDVASITQQGLPEINASVQMMLFVPVATPPAIVSSLGNEVRKIVSDPSQKQRFLNIGFEPLPASSMEANAIYRKTAEAWAPVIRRLNIKMD